MSLPLASASFLAFALTIYVLLDGFDLGVGVLLLFQPNQDSRKQMIDAITPTWDGNETWLIMAGVMLLAAFPIAYGILLPALYLPVIAMLLALAFRSVVFEFRFQPVMFRRYWDLEFAIGSLIAALMQGLVIGSLLQGVIIRGITFVGGIFDFARPFPLVCAAALLVGYMILGAGWLHLKGNREVDRFATANLRRLVPLFLLLCSISVVFGCFRVPAFGDAVFSHWRLLIWLASMFAAAVFGIYPAFRSKWQVLPLAFALLAFLIGIAALGVVVYPNIIPFRMSIEQAASSHLSQVFVLTGALLVTPVVLAYSAFAYWVFRGKTPERGWEG